jgi:hypothetical protein
MTWVRVDDQFQDHPKFLDVSLAGVGLWVAGLAYCSRYLTDGFISDAAAKRLGGTKKLLDELKAAGLWRPVDGGWLIHDYTDYNHSADDVQRLREKKTAAGRVGGRVRAGQMAGNGQANAKQSAKQSASTPPNNLSASKKSLNQANRQPLIRDGSVSNVGPSDEPAGQTAAAQANAKQSAKALASPHPIPYIDTSFVGTTSPPPNGAEEDEISKVIGDAVTILAERRLAARSPTLEPVVDLQKWLAVTTCNLLAEHRKRIKGLVLEGLDGPAIADAIDPPATRSPVVELAPRCPRCPTRHHPAEPHSVADGDLLPEPGSVP